MLIADSLWLIEAGFSPVIRNRREIVVILRVAKDLNEILHPEIIERVQNVRCTGWVVLRRES